MDFSGKQLDSLSLIYYRGVLSYKENLYEQDQFKIS